MIKTIIYWKDVTILNEYALNITSDKCKVKIDRTKEIDK